MSIPKIIHYCWFGGNPLPEKEQACIASWGKYCPDYEIREWNEGNFDFSQMTHTREAYEAKKWGFMVDHARMDLLYRYGGIWLDTDMELLGPIDDFLVCHSFIGFETPCDIGCGIVGAEQGHPWIKDMLAAYEGRHFLRQDGTLDLTTGPAVITQILVGKYGLRADGTTQSLREGIEIYATDWFCPKNWKDGSLNCTEHTRAIHHYVGSWIGSEEKQFTVRLKKWTPFLGAKLAFGCAYLVTGFEKYGFLRGCKIAAGRVLKRRK